MYILFHTGLGLSDICRLTLADIDMRERIIHVDHQLLRLSDMEYVICNHTNKDGLWRQRPSDDTGGCMNASSVY